jgi:hypothetical protein
MESQGCTSHQGTSSHLLTTTTVENGKDETSRVPFMLKVRQVKPQVIRTRRMARERVCTISRSMSPNWAPSWAPLSFSSHAAGLGYNFMTKVTFLGGINEIGGNCFLVEDKDTRLLLDLRKLWNRLVYQSARETAGSCSCSGRGRRKYGAPWSIFSRSSLGVKLRL